MARRSIVPSFTGIKAKMRALRAILSNFTPFAMISAPCMHLTSLQFPAFFLFKNSNILWIARLTLFEVQIFGTWEENYKKAYCFSDVAIFLHNLILLNAFDIFYYLHFSIGSTVLRTTAAESNFLSSKC